MICRFLEISLRIASVFIIAVCLSCARSAADEPDPERERHAVLAIRINAGDVASTFREGTRAGENDKAPADNGEKMQTLRVIILTRTNDTEDWLTEHNRFIDLTSKPETLHGSEQFTVSPNSKKKILLIANERNIKVRMLASSDPSDISGIPPLSAKEFFSKFSGTAGSWHTDEELRQVSTSLMMMLEDNKQDGGTLASPLAMSAVHEMEIGDASPEPYEKTLTIHRAAVKYTFRITNSDTKHTHLIKAIHIDNVASRQYFFPNAEFIDYGGFTAEDQYFWSSYSTPPGDVAKEMVIETETSIDPGKTVEFGPYYFPEGHNLTDNNVYRVAFSYRMDSSDADYRTEWCEVKWTIPEESEDESKQQSMTDLPRNTHVVVNVNFKFMEFTLKYTRCPWTEHEIDIPDFN